MDREATRARQKELQQRYREDPATARTEVAAQASFGQPGVTATVSTWAGDVRAGLHPATGGDGSDACSTEMLLQALVGCAGVTLRSVASAMRLPIRAASVTATGAFDARGTLGVSREVGVGMRDATVTALLDTDASDAQLARLAELTERYCVVAQSLAPAPVFVVRRAEADDHLPPVAPDAGSSDAGSSGV